METVKLSEKFALFDEYWQPRLVGELNGQVVKLAKLKGEFVWHHHETEDEMFLVVKGTLILQVKDETGEHDLTVEEGAFLIVPRGVEHRPVAPEEVQVMLFEPASTVNTGNVHNERTLDTLENV
ncbi:MAG: cupin domain-containing protein [Anaerolineae bacterium]